MISLCMPFWNECLGKEWSVSQYYVDVRCNRHHVASQASTRWTQTTPRSSRNQHLVSLLHTNLTSKHPHITLLSDMGPQKHNNEILRDQSKSESAFFFSIYLLYFEGSRNKSCMMSSLMHHLSRIRHPTNQS